jgi:hypothetical protein
VTAAVFQPLISPYVDAAVVGLVNHAVTAAPMFVFVMAVTVELHMHTTRVNGHFRSHVQNRDSSHQHADLVYCVRARMCVQVGAAHACMSVSVMWAVRDPSAKRSRRTWATRSSLTQLLQKTGKF